MISHNNSTSSLPFDEARPNWSWLQSRLVADSTRPLDHWLDQQLSRLEEDFRGLVTPRSEHRSRRQKLKQSDSRRAS